MMIGRLSLFAGLVLASVSVAQAADRPVKIGVLNDMSGLYADLTGPGSVIAARMAVEDFGGKALGRPIEIVSADHQNKPDVGLAIARRWLDGEGVDAIVDVPASSVGLGVQALTKEKGRTFLNTGGAASDFSGKACAPYSNQWAMDTFTMASSAGRALVKAGGKTWFFITADYAFGHALERDAMAAVKAQGGEVLGSIRVPISNQDFSSALLQAQGSGADVIALANAGGDTVRAINQAQEFGLAGKGKRVAAMVLFINDVHAIGLKNAQGTVVTAPFYWDLDDDTRAWSKRFMAQSGGRAPTAYQAAVYSALLHYFRAVEKVSSTDPAKTAAAMKEAKINDPLIKNGWIRKDGHIMRNYYLMEIKKPEDSKYPYDYYKVLATVPAEDVTKPLDPACELAQGK